MRANGDASTASQAADTAWERVKDLDTDGDGYISRKELPRQFRLTVTQGGAGFAPPEVRDTHPGRLVRSRRAQTSSRR